jgi:hypothetical protein
MKGLTHLCCKFAHERATRRRRRARCRTGGPSVGADLMVLQARTAGKLVVDDPRALPAAA